MPECFSSSVGVAGICGAPESILTMARRQLQKKLRKETELRLYLHRALGLEAGQVYFDTSLAPCRPVYKGSARVKRDGSGESLRCGERWQQKTRWRKIMGSDAGRQLRLKGKRARSIELSCDWLFDLAY